MRDVFPNLYKINKKETFGWLDESGVYEMLTNQTFCCHLSQLATAPGSLLLQKVTFKSHHPKWAMMCWKALKKKITTASQDQSSKIASTSVETAATAPIHSNIFSSTWPQSRSSSFLLQFLLYVLHPVLLVHIFRHLTQTNCNKKQGQSQRC